MKNENNKLYFIKSKISSSCAMITSISLSLNMMVPYALASSTDVEPIASGIVPRQMEYLDRGTVAVKTDNGIFLSWRLLGTENYDTAFDIYRDNELIRTVYDTTNLIDTEGSTDSKYIVVPKDVNLTKGKEISVWNEQYLTIPLEVPSGGTSLDGEEYTYSANDAAVADLDGDGEYEIILKWDPSNSFDSGQSANHSGNVYIDAYRLDGTKMWRIDLGVNINAGAHFTQIAAYDLDLDGKAEIAMKTAPGSKDGAGRYVSEASLLDSIKNTDNEADYRDSTGRVLSGDEYYTVFDGATGDALDTIYYPHPRGNVIEWGDDWGNRSERYLTAVAYLDGMRPSVIAWRGYYEKTTATAYNLIDKKLVQVADFNTDDEENALYAGNGNHNLTVGDVDNDGCDEIISGSLCLDNDLSVKWCSYKGHGDALHLADYDPVHAGMEYFSVHESSPFGMTVYDADTGFLLFHQDSDGDTGRGMMANIGYGDSYYDVWGSGSFYSIGGDLFYPREAIPDSTNFRIFWTDSVYDELLDGTGSAGRSFKIDGKDGRIQNFDGTVTNNYTKNNPCIQADILGDWREEILVRSDDNMSLRLYTTTIQTTHKLYTLMHDSAYRMQIVCQNAGYNQPPHIGYYISEANNKYDCRMYSSYVSTVHNGATAVRTANLPADKPQETPPPPTPIPTPAPESYYTIDENGMILSYSGDMKKVKIPETINGIIVTGIGNEVFAEHEEIHSVEMPDTIVSIGEKAFYKCSALGDLQLSNGLQTIDAMAFYYCSDLVGVSVPEGTREISEQAFALCSSLRWLKISEGLENIGSKAFYSCEVLSEVNLPESLKQIGSAAFRKCTSLTSITIPELVTQINDSVFMECTSLEKIALHNNIETIGVGTFRGCKALENIVLPENLTSIGNNAFYECSALKELNIPETVTVIPEGFAKGCSVLEKVNIPDNTEEIGKNAFSGCKLMQSVTLMPTVTKIGIYAFNATAKNFTIYGYTNSYAHNYATDNKINFEAIGYIDPTPKPIPTLPPLPTSSPEDAVQITTNDATEITDTSAVLNCSISGNMVWTVCYRYMSLSDGIIHDAQSYSGYGSEGRAAWAVEVNGLEPGTTYIYYAYNITGDMTCGGIKQFTTTGATPSPSPTASPSPSPTVAPTATPDPIGSPEPTQNPFPTDTPPDPTPKPRCKVTTGEASDITDSTAILNGELEIYNELAKDEIYYHFWKADSDEIKTVYGSNDTTPPYQGKIYNLEPETTYYYYAYNGTVTGETKSFKTEPKITPPDGYDYPYRIVSDSVDGNVITLNIESYETIEGAKVIFAEYDETGRLLKVGFKDVVSNENKEFAAQFEYSGSMYKAFIWEWDEMKLLAESWILNDD